MLVWTDLACTSFAYTDIISNSKLVTLLVIYIYETTAELPVPSSKGHHS